MTAAGFRRIARGLEEAVEQAHHGHPDFRVGGRIFATLAYPDTKWGMAALTPDQQRTLLRQHPAVFIPAKGAWGAQGATMVRLAAVDEETLGEVLTLAWRHAVEKGPTRSRRPSGIKTESGGPSSASARATGTRARRTRR